MAQSLGDTLSTEQIPLASEKDVASGYPGLSSAKGINGVNSIKLDRQASAPATPGTPGAELYVFNADGISVLEGRTETGGIFRFLRDQAITVKNNTGSTIATGKLVYITGYDATSGNPTVAVADNTSAATMNAAGLVVGAIANNTSGRVYLIGEITGIDTSAYTAGQSVYVGASGNLTGTKPAYPNYKQYVGEIEVVHATTGSVRVHIEPDSSRAPEQAPDQTTVDTGSSTVLVPTVAQVNARNAAKRRYTTGSATLVNEGENRYDSTRRQMLYHDSVRERAQSSMGYMPYAYPIGGTPNQNIAASQALPASGGSVAFPVVLEGHMLFDQVVFYNMDTATARGPVEFILLEDRLNNANALSVIAAGTLASWTPSAASVRIIPVTSAPVYLAPGMYWIVIKNNSAAQTLGFGSTAAGTLARNLVQTKTFTTAAFGTTLDMVAATWAKPGWIPGARLEGRVFGQTTVF